MYPIKINPENGTYISSNWPPEITEEFLERAYDIFIKEYGNGPLELGEDPKGYLKKSAGAFLLDYFFLCSAKEVTETGSWFIDIADDNRKYSAELGCYLLVEGRNAKEIDYLIRYWEEDDWDYTVMMDLHHYFLAEARYCRDYELSDICRVNDWAEQIALEGSSD